MSGLIATIARYHRRSSPRDRHTEFQRLVPAEPGDHRWVGDNAPRGTAISYYLKSAGGSATITISDAAPIDAPAM